MKERRSKVLNAALIIAWVIILTPISSKAMDNNNSKIKDNELTESIQKENGYLDFKKNTQAAVNWSNKNFSKKSDLKKDSQEVNLINSINKELRIKYLNRSELYQPYDIIEKLDQSFVGESLENMTLYANLTAEDFKINSKYFSENAEKAYDFMLKDSEFGIDHGYFMGSLSETNLDTSTDELIQIKLEVPKNTPIVRIGSITESKFMLQRNHVLKYTKKTLKTDKNNNPYVEISAEISTVEELEEKESQVEEDINDMLEETFKTKGIFTLDPVGLNAGRVLSKSKDVISDAFDSINSNGVFSEGLFDELELYFTDGSFVHTSRFLDILEDEESVEDKIKLFNKYYQKAPMGTTYPFPELSISVVSFGQYISEDPLPSISFQNQLSGILIHEMFHYFINTTKRFDDRLIFKGENGDNIFEKLVEKVKATEEITLSNLLNSSYPQTNWEEYICEAFRAKLFLKETISKPFKEKLVHTNRLLDNIYDVISPTIPENLKALKITGHNTKLTFNHASDKIGVEKYNIYQNGELIQSITLDKDKDGLAYPNPEENLKNTEILIVNLKPLTEYEFQVSAVDESLNESEKSTFLKIKTTDEIDDQTTLELQNVELYKNQPFDPNAPFKTVTDKDGNELKAEDIEWYYIDEKQTKILDTSEPGNHAVRIVYLDGNNDWQYSNTVTVTIKDDQTTLELQDVELYKNQPFDPDAPFKTVTDKDGNKLKAEDVEWYYIDEKQTKTLDTSETGNHAVRIVYLDGSDEWRYSNEVMITVK